MWHRETGVRGLWIFEQPFRFVGRMIEHDVTDRCNAPFLAKFFNDFFHGFKWNNRFRCFRFDVSKIGIDF